MEHGFPSPKLEVENALEKKLLTLNNTFKRTQLVAQHLLCIDLKVMQTVSEVSSEIPTRRSILTMTESDSLWKS